MEFLELDPNELKIDDTNERRNNINAKTDGGDLEKSIKENGVMVPVHVREVDEEFRVVAGQRRTLAAQAVGEDTIPVMKMDLNESEARAVSMMENDEKLRKKVPRKDRARATRAYVKKVGGKKIAAEKLGVSKQTIENRLETTKSFWKGTKFDAETSPEEETEELPNDLLARIRSVADRGEEAEKMAMRIKDEKIPRKVVNAALTESDTRKQFEEELNRLHYQDDNKAGKKIDIEIALEDKNAALLTKYAKKLGTTPEDAAKRLIEQSFDGMDILSKKGDESAKLEDFASSGK